MCYRKKSLIFILVIFLMTSTFTIGYAHKIKTMKNNNSDGADITVFGPNIVIPDDFPRIQDGINYANPGDVIFVRSGVYKENLLINKENLTLLGEDKTNTVIDGNKLSKKHTVDIISKNAVIQGFTIKNGWNKNEELWDLSGIRINASNTKIIGNIITKNRLGISTMSKTYNHTIKDNIFINDGLMFANYVYNFHMSINDFFHTVENNTLNGKPLYYFRDVSNYIVPEDAGQVILVNCDNVTIQNLELNNTDFAIALAGCNNCNVINNTIEETDGELILFFSENNTIQNNTISSSLHGICLDYSSKNNVVRYNDVSNNWIGISSITGSKYNKIYSNKIYKNKVGIEITTYYSPMKSHDHEIYQNQVSGSNYGILIAGGSENLSVYNNSIFSNFIGINIKESENNNISGNQLFKNIISATFFACIKNIWNHNYWKRPRILPKMIYGFRTVGNLPVPWVNIDKNPA